MSSDVKAVQPQASSTVANNATKDSKEGDGKGRSATDSAALDFECFLFGTAVAHYGSKIQLPSLSAEAKQLTEDQQALKDAFQLIDKVDVDGSAEVSRSDPAGEVCQFLLQSLRTRRVGGFANCAHGSSPEFADQQRKLNSEHPQLMESLAESLKSSRLDGRPDHIFQVVPHSSSAALSTLSRRIAQEFDQAVSAGASTSFAFHGSPTRNWYTILQAGFRNQCKENALYGHGIYLSTALHVSQDFAQFEGTPYQVRKADSVHKIPIDTRIKVVGVCEVAHTKTTRSHAVDASLPETYLVIPNPSHVRLRYLLVFSERSMGASPDLPIAPPEGQPKQQKPVAAPAVESANLRANQGNTITKPEQSFWTRHRFSILLLLLALGLAFFIHVYAPQFSAHRWRRIRARHALMGS